MSAHLWFQPFGARGVVDVDLGRDFSSIEDYAWEVSSTSTAFSGRQVRTVFSVTRRVDVTAELLPGTSYDVIAKLEALVNHLRMDGLVSVAESFRTLGAFLRVVPKWGTQTLDWRKNLFSAYGNYTPLLGDVLTLQGPAPGFYEELILSAGGSPGDTIATTTSPPVNRWDDAPWIFVRNKTFWPFLRLRQGADPSRLLTSGNRIAFALSLPLEVPPNGYDAIAVAPKDPFVLTDSPSHSIDLGVSDPPLGSGPIFQGTQAGPGRWW